MAELATPMFIGSTLLSATGQAMRGGQEAAAAEFRAQQLRIQEQQTRTAQQQAEAKRREDLLSNLETISVIRAGRGVGQASPTALTSINNVIDEAEGDIQTEKVNYLSRADSLRTGAEFAETSADYSLLSGIVGAGSSLLSGGYKLAGSV